MNLMRTEQDTLDAYIPGLGKYLSEVPLLELEKPGCGALAKFRELGGPALLVPAEYAGKGASLLEAVRIQRAVGSRSPSLAVATTMHHFSVASLVELTAAGNGFEWAMLMAIAENSWLLSSGFAEGKPGQHILTPAMRGAPADGGITVSGVKKPCSLTWSMNLMSASVAVTDPATGTDRLAVVLIPADSPGIQRAPFWQTTALAAAESDQVTLTDVFVPEALIFYPHDGESMDPVQARGFTWFELLISASYLGAATNLAERVIARGRGSDQDRAGLAIELETMAAALEQVASPPPRPPVITMPCSRGRSTCGSRPSRPSSAWSCRPPRPWAAWLHRVTRDRLPARRHPRPGLPPALPRRRRGPDRPLPRRRPADPLKRAVVAARAAGRPAAADLPQPLGPITATVSPRATSRSIPSTARTKLASRPYSLCSPLVRSAPLPPSVSFMTHPSGLSSSVRMLLASAGRPAAAARCPPGAARPGSGRARPWPRAARRGAGAAARDAGCR